MPKFKSLACATVLSLDPVAGFPDSKLPAWCCPNSCISLEQEASGLSRTRDGAVIGPDGERIPYSDRLHTGNAPDNRIHVCIGFDDFGDKQVKCLLTPLML